MLETKQNLLELLTKYFGFSSFWSGQEEVIHSVLKNNQNIVIMPTGAGKSLCYQLPALIFDNLTLVISPLIALMKDQVDSLNKIKIPATFINSSLNKSEYEARLKNIMAGKYKLIYIAPERFYDQQFMDLLQDLKVSLLAIDEAHCISEWGHDFRPSYLKIKNVIQKLNYNQKNTLKVIALTATATPEVREDIIKQLNFNNPKVFITGFKRPNLKLSAIRTSSYQKPEIILNLAKKIEGSKIIYAGTRNKVEEITAILREYGFSANGYHAGMENADRKRVQDSFMNGQREIIVATNAFGMGVDKSDIRLIIHNNMPSTLEAYYQEIGRAGRDGKLSECILLYSPQDRYLNEFFIAGDNPSLQTIKEIYRFLLHQDYSSRPGRDDLDSALYFTLNEIGQHITETTNELAVSTSLKILEREGYLQRMPEKENLASIKLNRPLDAIKEYVGNRAKSQLKIIETLADSFQANQENYVSFAWDSLIEQTDMEKSALQRGLNILAKSNLIDYNPPFKGRGIKLLKNGPLEIDYKKLEEKRNNDFRKLDVMESYVFTDRCRHQYILDYFGDSKNEGCVRMCDNCANSAPFDSKPNKKGPGNILDIYFQER